MASSSSWMKMKRKELEEVSDDFSDFSLSSPARKIRRLDVELPPIMEEEEVVLKPSVTGNEVQNGVDVAIEEMLPANEERAIVLFKPINNPLLHSPSNFSVSSQLISGLKNHLWSNQSSHLKSMDGENEGQDRNPVTTRECLAVVPWVPSQVFPSSGVEAIRTEAPELMEAEEMGEATMEIEDSNASVEQGQSSEFGGMMGAEGLQQWHQQHCMTPQLPQNASTPIVWFR